jgi:hypothetical protein
VIRYLEINGLKAFGSRVIAPIASLTLVFGNNSAGKSSLLQALLLLKQTIEESPDGALQSSGALVDLGTYANLVHRHEGHRSVQLGLGAGEEAMGIGLALRFGGETSVAHEVIAQWSHSARDVRVVVQRRDDGRGSWSAERWPPPELTAWVASVMGPRKHLPTGWLAAREAGVRAGGFDLDLEAWDGMPTEVVSAAVARVGGQFIAEPGPGNIAATTWLPAKLDGSDDQGDRDAAAVRAVIDTALRRVTSCVIDALGSLTYLGPVRSPPPRIVTPSGRPPTGLGTTGDLTAARLANDPGLLASVNRHLAELDIDYQLEVVPLAAEDALLREAYTLRLLDQRYDDPVPIHVADVGYGISQLLPVIVAGVVSRGGTVVVEQPELHVHPGLQARFGQVLLEQSADTNFIIETHSEHLMLRLLRNVRGGLLNTRDLAVLYVGHAPDDTTTFVQRLDVDDDGEFADWWPDGFFTEREEELFDPPPS